MLYWNRYWLLLLNLFIFTGCHSSDPIVKAIESDPISLSVAAPQDMQGGIDAQWTANWTGGTAPFSIAWNFGGGADPDSITESLSQHSHTATVNMVNDSVAEDAEYSVTFMVEGSAGRVASKTMTCVVGAQQNQRPVIDSTVFDEEALTVVITASDPDADAVLTATVTVPDGLQVDAPAKTLSQTGPLSTSFQFSSLDEAVGGSGEVTVTVKDQHGGKAFAAVWVYVPRFGVAANEVTIKVPDNMSGGESAQWLVTWTGESGTYTVDWDFGGGADPEAVSNTIDGQFHNTTVRMLNASYVDAEDYTVQATVTDADGVAARATAVYTVGPINNQPPVIESAAYIQETQTLTITASDPDPPQMLAISIAPPVGLVADRSVAVAGQPGQFTANFRLDADDVFVGGSGNALVVASDQHGGKAQEQRLVEVPLLELEPDTLYIVPMARTARVGDVVQVVLATGQTDSPFQYLMCANVTMPEWVLYEQQTYNIGAVGGAIDEVDGLWAADGMQISEFLIGPDSFYLGQEVADLEIDGRHRLELVAIPVSSNELPTVKGQICNFGVRFTQAGTASFGLVDKTGAIDRTCYRDFDDVTYYWSSLMAGPEGNLTVVGVNNTVIVTE